MQKTDKKKHKIRKKMNSLKFAPTWDPSKRGLQNFSNL